MNSEVRIWPHHFDTGIYLEVNSKLGIGFGWAMADKMIDQPYFYFTPYGLNGHKLLTENLEDPEHGFWHRTRPF